MVQGMTCVTLIWSSRDTSKVPNPTSARLLFLAALFRCSSLSSISSGVSRFGGEGCRGGTLGTALSIPIKIVDTTFDGDFTRLTEASDLWNRTGLVRSTMRTGRWRTGGGPTWRCLPLNRSTETSWAPTCSVACGHRGT